MKLKRCSFKFWIFLLMQISSIEIYCQAIDLKTEIEKLIRFDTEIDFRKVPGFIVTVIDNDSIYFFSFGTKVKKEKIDFKKNDIFEIGSVSKVFTASLISILVDEGLISYSDRVNSYFPEEYQNPRLNNLTISDLITHQSGMPRLPGFFGKKEKDFQNPYKNYQYNDLLSFYRDFIPENKKFQYSHTNYGLLELILKKRTSKSLQDLMEEKIFSPLGMSDSFIDFPEKKENVISPGYDRAQKPVQPWTFSSFKASEGIKLSADDMTKFLKANMNMSDSGLDEIFKYNFTPQLNTGFNTQLSVAMGWHTINMNHFHIITHTGKTSGHNAFVGMVRETKTAVVILANSSFGTEDLGIQILRMINYNWKRINI